MREFCRYWLENRDTGAAALLSNDIDFVGAGEKKFAQGKIEMAKYLRQDIREIPELFICERLVIHKQQVTERVCTLSTGITLKTLVCLAVARFFLLYGWKQIKPSCFAWVER